VTWSALPSDVQSIAESVLTEKQREAWELELVGFGMMRIARRLSLSKGAVVARIDGAHRKLRRAGVRQDEFGRWYVDEEVAA
jgi:DNA-directed RNA polymerase specialized sigma24 family protein